MDEISNYTVKTVVFADNNEQSIFKTETILIYLKNNNDADDCKKIIMKPQTRCDRVYFTASPDLNCWATCLIGKTITKISAEFDTVTIECNDGKKNCFKIHDECETMCLIGKTVIDTSPKFDTMTVECDDGTRHNIKINNTECSSSKKTPNFIYSILNV